MRHQVSGMEARLISRRATAPPPHPANQFYESWWNQEMLADRALPEVWRRAPLNRAVSLFELSCFHIKRHERGRKKKDCQPPIPLPWVIAVGSSRVLSRNNQDRSQSLTIKVSPSPALTLPFYRSMSLSISVTFLLMMKYCFKNVHQLESVCNECHSFSKMSYLSLFVLSPKTSSRLYNDASAWLENKTIPPQKVTKIFKAMSFYWSKLNDQCSVIISVQWICGAEMFSLAVAPGQDVFAAFNTFFLSFALMWLY